MKAAAIAFVAMLAAARLGAQRPDFSGTWDIDKPATRLQGLDLANLDSATVVIVQAADRLKFTRRFVVRGQGHDFSYELPIGGREDTLRVEGQATALSRLYWTGDTLVFDTRIVAPAGVSTNVVHYVVAEGGRVIRAEERHRGDANYDNVWVFRRRSP